MRTLAPIIIIVCAAALTYFRARTTHFECPSCGHSFKVSWLKFTFAPHAGFARYVTCPNCSRSAMMQPVSDKQ